MKFPIWLTQTPKRLFLIDGLGALVSAVMLGVVWVAFESFFGLPSSTCYFLALFPCLFAIYDAYAFFSKRQKISLLLKGIALLNTGYCVLSLALATYHYASLTTYGWVYLLLEIGIVLGLASVEWRMGTKVHLD